MTKFSGSFTGKISWQASVTIPVPGNHNLGVLETRGPQTSIDPEWNDAAISYYGMADLTDGSGLQRGYFHNVRADGEQDWGSFEGKCSAPGFLDSGLTVFASMLPRPARRSHVAPERGFDSGTSLASTARCTSA